MFREGDRVTVYITDKENTARDLRKFNGKSFVIKRVKTYKQSNHTYILDGCKSSMGINFEFHEDWLVPTTE